MGLKYYLHKVMMENCLLTIKSKDSIPFEAIHFMQSPGHEPFVADYLNDLEEVVELVAQGEITARGPSANYN